ncbi:MAG: hypothetical protein AAGJ55_12505, partial [Cyanobacteria bacterium J06555_12]
MGIDEEIGVGPTQVSLHDVEDADEGELSLGSVESDSGDRNASASGLASVEGESVSACAGPGSIDSDDERHGEHTLECRYRLRVVSIFAEQFLSLLNVRELTTDLTDDIRAAAAALESVTSLLQPLDRRSRAQRLSGVLLTEGGAIKLLSGLATRRPVLSTGLATWLGIA